MPESETVPGLFPPLSSLPVSVRHLPAHPPVLSRAVLSAAQSSLLPTFSPDNFPATSARHYLRYRSDNPSVTVPFRGTVTLCRNRYLVAVRQFYILHQKLRRTEVLRLLQFFVDLQPARRRKIGSVDIVTPFR